MERKGRGAGISDWEEEGREGEGEEGISTQGVAEDEIELRCYQRRKRMQRVISQLPSLSIIV